MASVGKWFHPVRAWLWLSKRERIQVEAALLLPNQYQLDCLVQEIRPDIDELQAAGVLNPMEKPTILTAAVRKALNEQKRLDAAYGAAEGAVLYGLYNQLHQIDGQLFGHIAEGIKGALLNTANLGIALQSVGSIATGKIPAAFLPLAQPIINSCLDHAENWCHEHLVGTADIAADHSEAVSSIVADHGGTISEAFTNLHSAWINPSEIITSRPIDVMTAHLDHVDTAGQIGESLTHGAADAGISHAGDHAASALGSSIPVPWFTLLRSGHREFQLLQTGKTDLGSAAKNVATDSVAMVVGAKGGAAIGTAILPGLGTLLGGLIGGIAGKYAGTEYKQKDLKAATSRLEAHAEAIRKAESKLNSGITSKFNKQKEKEQETLKQSAATLAKLTTKSAKEFAAWREASQTMSEANANTFLKEGIEELQSLIEHLQQMLSSINFSTRILWPNVQVEAIHFALETLEERQWLIKSALVENGTQKETSTSRIFGVLGQAGVLEIKVREVLKNQEVIRQNKQTQFEEVMKQSQAEILQERIDAVARLDALLKSMTTEAQNRLEPMANELASLVKVVHREMEKLGIAVPEPTTDANVKKEARKGRERKGTAKSDTSSSPESVLNDDEDESPAFMKPMHPSISLAKIVGNKPQSRIDITAKVWKYIEDNDLLDPNNSSRINTDAKLRAVCAGREQVGLFELTGLVNKHLA